MEAQIKEIKQQRKFIEGRSIKITVTELENLLYDKDKVFLRTEFCWVAVPREVIQYRAVNLNIYYLITDKNYIYISKEKIKYTNVTP